MVDFSSQPAMRGYFAPARFEADIYDCEVTGEIPAELDGAFYRLHPDWFYPPNPPDDIPLASDGYMSMFRFRNGVVDYKGRYVRTERFEQQRAARRQLYGYYRNPFTDDPSVRDPEQPHRRTTANTTPVVLRRRALRHQGRRPAAPDGPQHPGDARAHRLRRRLEEPGLHRPSRRSIPSPARWSPSATRPPACARRDVFLAIFDRAGAITREWRFEVPYTSMLHDMALTREHVIIPGGGCVTSLERLHEGKIHWGWDTSKPSYYGIIPRDGEAKDIRWFLGPERAMVHTANARTEGSKVIMEAPVGRREPLALVPGHRRRPVHRAPEHHPPLHLRPELQGRPLHRGDAVRAAGHQLHPHRRPPSRPAYRYIYVQYFDPERPARAGRIRSCAMRPTASAASTSRPASSRPASPARPTCCRSRASSRGRARPRKATAG